MTIQEDDRQYFTYLSFLLQEQILRCISTQVPLQFISFPSRQSTSTLCYRFCPEILIMKILRGFLEVMHMRLNEHCSQLSKVTMIGILNFHNAPWINPPSNLFSGYFYYCIATGNCKWNGRFEFSILLFEFFVFFLITLRKLVNLTQNIHQIVIIYLLKFCFLNISVCSHLNLMCPQILQNLILQFLHFCRREYIRFGNDRNQIHPCL